MPRIIEPIDNTFGSRMPAKQRKRVGALGALSIRRISDAGRAGEAIDTLREVAIAGALPLEGFADRLLASQVAILIPS
jgi:hypothetical protein